MSINNKKERVAYFNGQIVPESDVKVPFRDRGFKYGDAVFDMTRTFGLKIFKLEGHIKRFYNSLKYIQIDPGLSENEMVNKTKEVFEANAHLLGDDDDFWVGQRVSRGIDLVGGDMWDTDVKPQDPEAWAILLDTRGFLSEGIGSNIFTIKNDTLYTPKDQYVLGGISRETAIELAEDLGLKVVEKDIDIFDAFTADEIFLTSTSLCICGVRSIQGRKLLPENQAAGPITKALMNAYVDLVDFDWISQYLRRLEQ